MSFGEKGVKSGINVTPLVDVVLVLLIIFMVVTPLLQRGRPVQLPRARLLSEPRRGGDPILLSITSDGRTWVDRTEVPMTGLAGAVTGEIAARPGAPVVLKADRELDYRIVREVMLELSRSRVAGVSLAATRAKAGEPE